MPVFRLLFSFCNWFVLLAIACFIHQNVLGQVPERTYASKYRESQRLLDLAKEKIAEKQYTQALALLDESLQYHSQNAETYFNRAVVKEETEDPEGALTDYQIVLLLDSTYQEAAFNRAKLRYNQQQYHRAIGDFKKTLSMGSSGTQVLYFKGTPVNNSDDAAIQSITTTYSMSADIHNYIGLCYHALQFYDSAIISFNQALDLRPDDANYYVNRGLSLSAKGNGEDAMKDFKAALDIDASHPIAQYNLTQQMEMTGKLEASAYDDLIKNNPEFASPYVNRALVKIDAGDLAGALQDLDRAVEIDNQNSIIYVNRGLVYERLEQHRKALKDYNQAIRLDPFDAKAFRSRSRVLHELDELELSLEDLNEAIKLEPSHGGSFFNRGLVYRDLGNYEAACSDLRKAITLDIKMARKAYSTYCDDPEQ